MRFPTMWVCATSKGSDQPAHMRGLVRAFASRLIRMSSLACSDTMASLRSTNPDTCNTIILLNVTNFLLLNISFWHRLLNSILSTRVACITYSETCRKRSLKDRQNKGLFCLFCCFTVSSLNNTFSWASLNQNLTSTSLVNDNNPS